MRILFYNWVQFDNKKNIGGGVNIYQRNLIEYLIKNTENEVYFLSSGWKYNPFKDETYVQKTTNIFGTNCHSFEVINSTVIAPTYASFMNPERYLNDKKCYEILDRFITEKGPFDVIHFNNIEGISVNVLELKEKYPTIKFVLSIHNYQTICPLVQYFDNRKQCICENYLNGENCLTCIDKLPSSNIYYRACKNYLRERYKNESLKFFILKSLSKFLKYKSFSFMGSSKTMNADLYKKYREKNIEYLNKYCDVILAVSDRVKNIMINNGVDSNKIITSYIGTKFADNQLKYSITQQTKPFTIAYLGYKRIDKGFYFLLETLRNIDVSVASKINIVLAVKDIKKEDIKDLTSFNEVIIYNGYTHKDLYKIMSKVNLGIVPVLWEDNLPQVAIEMVACGVPILCSDFGGASELCSCEIFKFKGGSQEDFTRKLKYILDNPKILKEYWENHKGLTTMNEHVKELCSIYRNITI